jgi:hypothetical protein
MADAALCFRCGTFKKAATTRCPSCGFTPELEIDIVKSRILGKPYTFAVGEHGDVIETGRTKAELQGISEQIKSGSPYEFPAEEVAGVSRVYSELNLITPRRLVKDLIKWLAPPVALGLLFAVVLLWRR